LNARTITVAEATVAHAQVWRADLRQKALKREDETGQQA
jgi:hypothetical protein